MDDGISGAEFAKRPGLQRMLAYGGQFEVLIVSEQKSLGRESVETGYLIKQLAQAGAEIFEYGHGKCLTPKTWLDKAMPAVQSAADEAHLGQTRERVHEGQLHKIRKGFWSGGRVFGYSKEDMLEGVDISFTAHPYSQHPLWINYKKNSAARSLLVSRQMNARWQRRMVSVGYG